MNLLFWRARDQAARSLRPPRSARMSLSVSVAVQQPGGESQPETGRALPECAARQRAGPVSVQQQGSEILTSFDAEARRQLVSPRPEVRIQVEGRLRRRDVESGRCAARGSVL